MELHVTYKNINSSDSLKEYAQKKLDKLDKLLLKPATARVVFSTEKNDCQVDIELTGGKLDLRVSERSETMQSSLDVAVDKLKLQLVKLRDKVIEHRPKSRQDAKNVII